ncbi:MAG: 2-hydroxyacyl-CoA dehydratase [Deltaproteobacteria bacterium]|nr:2-hydroxyacyl-CoA dehydratase [Deltaproteobacteria bacterium]
MDFQQILAELVATQTDPHTRARQWKSANQGTVIAHLLPDVPEEIIHASGALPLAVTGVDRGTSLAESHIPSFVCSLLRNPLEMALRRELEFIDGMVIPYVCDSARAFSQVWEANFPDLFNHTLWLPKKVSGDSAKQFLFSEFMRLKKRLEVFLGREITDQSLRHAIGVYNQNRRLLRRLFALRKKGRIPLPYADYLSVVKASMTMPREDHNTLLARLLEGLKEECRPCEKEESVRVFLLGSLGEPHSVLTLFDELGMDVVDDHFYDGTRCFLQDVDEAVDPMEGLVSRQLSKAPLSGFHYQDDRWRQYLLDRVRDGQIEGVVYFPLMYCDPMEFDYPLIKGLLGEMGIPVLFLETDFHSGSLGQVRTRLEAFAEMLREKKDESLPC